MLQGKPKGGPTRTPGTRKGTGQATVGWPGIQSPAARANPTPLPKVNFALLDLDRPPTIRSEADSTPLACAARPSSGPVSAFPANEDTDPNAVMTDRFERRVEPMLPPRPNPRGRRRRARGFAALWVLVACASFFWFAERPTTGSVRGALPSEPPSAPPSTDPSESAQPEYARLGATDEAPQPARASNAGLVSRRASAAPLASRKRAARVTRKQTKHMSRAALAARAKRKHKRRVH